MDFDPTDEPRLIRDSGAAVWLSQLERNPERER